MSTVGINWLSLCQFSPKNLLTSLERGKLNIPICVQTRELEWILMNYWRKNALKQHTKIKKIKSGAAHLWKAVKLCCIEIHTSANVFHGRSSSINNGRKWFCVGDGKKVSPDLLEWTKARHMDGFLLAMLSVSMCMSETLIRVGQNVKKWKTINSYEQSLINWNEIPNHG